MSQQLTLVASTPQPELKPSADEPKYSAYDRETIQRYQAMLEVSRCFKFHSSASQYVQIIFGNEPGKRLPIAFLNDDLIDWCKENERSLPKPMPSPSYLAHGLKAVTGTVFLPNGPSLVRPKHSRHRYVNTYQKFERQFDPIELSTDFLELLASMFPDPEERKTYLQYCSHMFQRPEERPSWHPMLLSETGTGKGFFLEAVLTPLLCGQTRIVKKYGELTGRFANVMDATILVQLDDCKSRREDVQTQLKSLMTEERVLLEPKGLASEMVHTFTRFFLATNEQVPLDLDESDRRWWIPKRLGYSNGLTGDEGRKDRQKLIQRVADWLKQPGALEAVHKHFMEYDLTGFDPKSTPMTETLRELIAKSVTMEQSLAEDFFRVHPTKVLKSVELIKALVDARLGKPSNIEIRDLFLHCGYRQEMLRGRDGKPSRWWLPVSMTKSEAERTLADTPEF